tara:strand:+ start:257 stop:499 length:243 start_codon:yes stop_codon:yes gene_type:complete
MVTFKNSKGWEFITYKEKKKIELALEEIKNPQSDRNALLDFLFDIYNLHLGGRYSRSSQTCANCVMTVIKTITNKINNGK